LASNLAVLAGYDTMRGPRVDRGHGRNSGNLHEDPSLLGSEVINRHRAVALIMEELEAVDWYDQRVPATDDPELAAV
jgi:hypothetical protein